MTKELKTDQIHIQRINEVKQFIDNNLSEKLLLSDLAEKAHLSAFHFQRVFKSIEGETPKQYIKRRRLEAVAHHITTSDEQSMLEIALQYGFNSLQALSRAFKNYYGLSPDQFRQKEQPEKIEILQLKISSFSQQVIDNELFIEKANSEELEVEIESIAPMKVVYFPTTLKNPETVVSAYQKIVNWAKANKVFCTTSEVFGLLDDYPAFTPLEKCRFYACVSVDGKPKLRKDIHFMEVPNRNYAKFLVHGGVEAFVKAITKFANSWLPKSGYQISHIPAIIKPLQNPLENHPHDITYQVYLAILPK